MRCHNCGSGMSLGNFIKTIDEPLYKRYCLDSYGNQPFKKKKKKVQHHRVSPKILKGATRLTQLNSNHIARVFVDTRKIPKKYHHKLYYVDNFAKFIESAGIKPLGKLGSEPRIIIPYFDKDSNVFAMQGRALDSKGLRYITFRFDKDYEVRYPYGIDTLNIHNKIYVVEGPFDSMFINNCIAVGSSQIVTHGQDGFIYSLDKKLTVIIFDNEKRNKEIVAKIELAIKQGFSVCIWPEYIKQKDINDMVLDNYQVQKIIDDNTFNGLQATLRINEWKKV